MKRSSKKNAKPPLKRRTATKELAAEVTTTEASPASLTGKNPMAATGPRLTMDPRRNGTETQTKNMAGTILIGMSPNMVDTEASRLGQVEEAKAMTLIKASRTS